MNQLIDMTSTECWTHIEKRVDQQTKHTAKVFDLRTGVRLCPVFMAQGIRVLKK